MQIDIDQGMDLRLGSVPARAELIKPGSVALLGADYPGLRPRLVVEAGDRVARGDVLFTDRAHPEIRFTTPESGVIRAVHRGARRQLRSVIVDVEPDVGAPKSWLAAARPEADAGDVRALLLQTGLWPALRTRPFDRVPVPDAAISELFVTAIDTNPLAPDPTEIISHRVEAFFTGVRMLSKLAGTTYLCLAADTGLEIPDLESVVPVEFRGSHPAGLPGTHIYSVAGRLGRRPPESGICHVGYQDVIAIGALFLQGSLDTEVTLSVAGPGTEQPRMITTTRGAHLPDLSVGAARGSRIISGSVLSGRSVTRTTDYLGRYHQQVVLLPPAAERGDPAGRAGTLTLERFERVWPFEVPVLPILRALMIEDTETVRALGCTLLAEEDLALCSYVCPAGNDYGAALSRTLEEIRRGD